MRTLFIAAAPLAGAVNTRERAILVPARRTLALAAVLVVAVSPIVYGATLYVQDTGTDGVGCGLSTSPCRSISQALDLAVAGDTIIVGPGRYGDLNENGILGEPGEEWGFAGCGCILAVRKAVILKSSGGAAVTVIDGRTVEGPQTVLLTATGGAFGQAGKGFTVTQTATGLYGIVIDSINYAVRGNKAVCSEICEAGILGINTFPVVIEGNEATGWNVGIQVGPGKTVRKNQVSGNGTSIWAVGGSVVGNVVAANVTGMILENAAQALSNAVQFNRNAGIFVRGAAGFTGVVRQNNISGHLKDE